MQELGVTADLYHILTLISAVVKKSISDNKDLQINDKNRESITDQLMDVPSLQTHKILVLVEYVQI